MSNQGQVTVLRNPEELAQSVAQMMSELMRCAIEERGICIVALAGGETPRRVYQLLAGDSHRGIVDWGRVHVFFTDERMVPRDHPESNYGMVRKELLSRVPIPVDHVHRIKGERPPVEAALECEREIGKVFDGVWPRFDLIMLGVGEDGHTASLFPHTASVGERTKTVLGYFVPRLTSWRVTLTLPVLLNARHVLFLAAGMRKAEILGRIHSAVEPSAEIPASLVRPHDGLVQWMLDADAASLLPGGGAGM